ncbi:MAG: cache domain-containing protein [Bacteroidota bacterium]
MIKKITYIIAAFLLMLLVYLGYDYTTFLQKRNALVENKGKETTAALRDQVDGILSKIAAEGVRLAELFGSQEFTDEQIRTIIRESALSIPEIQGVTACFEPYSFSDDRRLYCPYYNKGSQDYIYVEDTYDYSIAGAKGTAWYTSVRDGGAKWVEPYFASAAQDWYVDYGIPFYYSSGKNKGKVRGTITMSFVCSGFKSLVHKLSVGKTGYGIITSNKGTFLAHPINEYIGTTKLETVKEQPDVDVALRVAFEGILAGKTGSVTFFDEEQKDNTLFFYDQIPSANWGLGLLFYEQDLLLDTVNLNRLYIKIAIVFSFFFICILGIYYNKDHLDEGEIWSLGIVASFLLFANVFLVDYLQHSSNHLQNRDKSSPITDLTTLGNFVTQQHLKSEKLKTPKLRSVPTGIYIERLEFEDSYNLNVGGTVWQKYPLDLAEEVSIGFSLPQMSPFAEASYIEEAYRKRIESKEGVAGYLLVGWEIRVTLRLNLKYADFPLDKRHLSIQILPLDRNDQLLFTPDLASYSFTNPSKKSGLNPAIQISGSEVLESYFNYSTETYDTDFGYGTKGLFEEVPVLHFNIDIRRLLLNAFVTYLIPIVVTMVMVFMLIYACFKTDERQGIIESMAAFFFVLVFSHIDLRKEIVTADLIYIEFFYFIAYFMLILATINLIVYTKDKSHVFDYNENQIFKAAFFPIFFLCILVVTLWKFY